MMSKWCFNFTVLRRYVLSPAPVLWCFWPHLETIWEVARPRWSPSAPAPWCAHGLECLQTKCLACPPRGCVHQCPPMGSASTAMLLLGSQLSLFLLKNRLGFCGWWLGGFCCWWPVEYEGEELGGWRELPHLVGLSPIFPFLGGNRTGSKDFPLWLIFVFRFLPCRANPAQCCPFSPTGNPVIPISQFLVTSKWAFIQEAIMVFFSNYVGEWEITSKVGFDFLLAPPPPTTLVPTPLDWVLRGTSASPRQWGQANAHIFNRKAQYKEVPLPIHIFSLGSDLVLFGLEPLPDACFWFSGF